VLIDKFNDLHRLALLQGRKTSQVVDAVQVVAWASTPADLGSGYENWEPCFVLLQYLRSPTINHFINVVVCSPVFFKRTISSRECSS
jgi:hypothetical protein